MTGESKVSKSQEKFCSLYFSFQRNMGMAESQIKNCCPKIALYHVIGSLYVNVGLCDMITHSSECHFFVIVSHKLDYFDSH